MLLSWSLINDALSVNDSQSSLEAATMKLALAFLAAAVATAHGKTLVFHRGRLADDLHDDPGMVQMCNGCQIFNAVNMSMTQVINVHIKKGSQVTGPVGSAMLPISTEGTPHDLPSVIGFCNGCNVFNANSMT